MACGCGGTQTTESRQAAAEEAQRRADALRASGDPTKQSQANAQQNAASPR